MAFIFGFCAATSDGQVLTTLYVFTNGSDGAHPYAGLIQGTDGRLYGTAEYGGTVGYGTIFAVNTDGTGFTTLHPFMNGVDGSSPLAGLVQGTDGRLYGAAQTGGIFFGTLFAINTDGTGFTTLHEFTNGNDGANPNSALIHGTDGRLYGTAENGGAAGYGTIFAVNTDGTDFTTLYDFTNGSDGAYPIAGLIEGTDGRLYGTAENGGANLYYGAIFAINTDGTGFTTLWSFTGTGSDGSNPYSGLIQGTDGRLYGTNLLSGGGAGAGTIFAINTDGTGFTTLWSFPGGTGGSFPYGGLTQGTDGKLYGTNYGGGEDFYGSIFAINTDGTGFATLWSFTGGAGGGNPYAGLTQGTDGTLYGSSYGAA